MKKIWFDEAWEDYLYWQGQDKKTFFIKTEPSQLPGWKSIRLRANLVLLCHKYKISVLFKATKKSPTVKEITIRLLKPEYVSQAT